MRKVPRVAWYVVPRGLHHTLEHAARLRVAPLRMRARVQTDVVLDAPLRVGHIGEAGRVAE